MLNEGLPIDTTFETCWFLPYQRQHVNTKRFDKNIFGYNFLYNIKVTDEQRGEYSTVL
jgi:hypothetical protein